MSYRSIQVEYAIYCMRRADVSGDENKGLVAVRDESVGSE